VSTTTVTPWPLFSIPVKINAFLRRYDVYIVKDPHPTIVAGSHEGLAYQLFRENRRVRPRRRRLEHNPTRGPRRRTDFGARITRRGAP
jgi:hypothetical protein